jgi:putative SOS response-associated peptidase YedK
MCGRYYFDIDEKELKNIVDTVQGNLYGEIKTGEIYPTNNVAMIISDGGKTLAKSAKWGFPKWDSKGVIINARAEGISEKRMFKNIHKSNRCIIPASAYFEWNDKDKYMFKNDNSILYIAGIYNKFVTHTTKQLSIFDEEIEKAYTAFTIITKEANSYVSDIHTRMPLIFNQAEIKHYLSGESIDVLLADNNYKLSYSSIS